MKGPWLLAVLCALLHAVGSNAASDAAGPDAAGLDAALARGQVEAAAPAALNQSSVSVKVVDFAAADAVHARPIAGEHDVTLSRILLDAGGCANTGLSNLGVNLPNNARWSAANGCSNTAQTSGVGVACTAECDAGYVANGGGFSATCVAASGGAGYEWSTTDTSLACSGCSGTPVAAGHSLPAGAAWGCVGTTTGIGNICTAVCAPGYSLSGGAFVSVCCGGNNWQAPVGPPITCTAIGCSGTPGYSLPANVEWACGSSTAGVDSTCKAQCAAGYRQAGGPWESTCGSPSWKAPIGTPINCTFVVVGGPCPNDPGPSTTGLPDNAAWACTGSSTASGLTCKASCKAGYGSIGAATYAAACQDGFWQEPSGALTCALATAPCPNLPDPAWLPAGGKWDCPGGVNQGGACTASCQAGYTKTGNINAFCFNGQYAQPPATMSCAPPAPAPCTSQPDPAWLPAGGKWDCPGGVSQGGPCTASCQAGYTKTGNLSALCFYGNYSQPTTPMSCTPSGCKNKLGSDLDPSAVWGCTLPATHGDKCTAACNGAAAPPNPPTVVCDFGAWVYSSGSCGDLATKNFYVNMQAPPELIASLKAAIASGKALQLGNMALLQPQNRLILSLLNPAQIAFLQVWIAQSSSSSQRGRRLADQGLSELVVGMRVSLGSGVIAQTVGAALDKVLTSPSATNYILAQGLEVWRSESFSEDLLQQVSLGVSDSTGRPIGDSAGADGCGVSLLPTTTANNSIGVWSTEQAGPMFNISMYTGWDTIYVMYDCMATTAITGQTKLSATIVNSSTTQCSVNPENVTALNSSVVVACKKLDGTPFLEPAAFSVLVTANYTCSGQPSAFFDTTNVALLPAPTLTLRPGKQPAPSCGGKPAVAVFRYHLQGLRTNQDFILTAKVAPSCTVQLTPRPSKSNGIAVVTCSGAFPPGTPVTVGLNLTASAQACHDVKSTSKVDVHVACCMAGSSYAKGAATNSPTCFQHVKPGTTAAQCNKAVNASGYLNQGPGSATLFLAQNARSCSDSIGVGNVTVSCPDGGTAKKLHFVIQSLASRLVVRRYLVLCAAPTSPVRCPSPFWISTRVKPPQGSSTPPGWPEGLNSTTTNGVTTIEFNVAARCACSGAFFGVVESAKYRNLPAAACGR
uniref:Sushi domain-containing protein n=1 Tax=Tetradesmus obliquus TaxID=3088 RepID=A0A383VBM0_TETOB|eukprot:jgi/Sobl393_1/16089/SZX62581.1